MNRTQPETHTSAGDDTTGERHLLDYVRVVYKRRWIAIPVFLIVFVSAAINTLRTVPVYDATARTIIEQDAPAVAGLEELFRTREGWVQDEFFQTQYRMLQSRRLARRTIRLLGLESDPRFSAQAQETSSSTETLWTRATSRVTA